MKIQYSQSIFFLEPITFSCKSGVLNTRCSYKFNDKLHYIMKRNFFSVKFLFDYHYESYQMSKIEWNFIGKSGFCISYNSITQKNNVQLLKIIYLLIKYKKLAN